jgi:hypothetical protein
MKSSCLPMAILLVLAAPAAIQADTVYYHQSRASGIQKVSGTVVEETKRVVRIATEDGRTVSIPRADVFEIVRDARSAAGREIEADSIGTDRGPGSPLPARTSHHGIKGGLCISNLTVEPRELQDDGSLRSYAAGLWWDRPLRGRMTLRTEALYAVKGDAESAGGYVASTRISSVDLSVLGKVGLMGGSRVRSSFFFGPSVAVILSAKSRLEGERSDVRIDVKDQLRSLDPGIVVGGGLDFTLRERTCGIEVRYSRGLSNVAGDSANGRARTSAFGILGEIGLQ